MNIASQTVLASPLVPLLIYTATDAPAMGVSRSPFAQAADELSNLGFHVLPLEAGGKAIRLPGWTSYATTRPTEAEIAKWSLRIDANIGAAMGSPRDDGLVLVAIDIDVTDIDAIERVKSALPRSPMAKLGSKGETLFFRAPAHVDSRNYQRAGGGMIVELLSKGRQTVLPPSIHPETKRPYVWTVGPVAIDRLPILDEADLERLAEVAEALGAASATGVGGNAPDAASNAHERARTDENPVSEINRGLNTRALANLDAWVPALDLPNARRLPDGRWQATAFWRPSGDGNPIERRKRNLSFDPTGIADFGDNHRGYTATDVVMQTLGLKHDKAFRWLSDRVGSPLDLSGMPSLDDLLAGEERKRQKRGEVAPRNFIEHNDGTLSDEATGEVLAPAVRRSEREIPDHLTRVPGLLGEVLDWIDATALRPNRVLSLGAAISTLGTLAGRRDATPKGGSLQLYVLTLARTGAGKQHGLDAVDKLITAAGAGRHLGASEAMSQTALIHELQHEPLLLSLADEIGAYLSRINARNAGSHELGVKKLMRSMWGVNFGTYRTPSWAATDPVSIHSPSFSVYGVSTPSEFYEALKGSDVTNGMLNRFLLLSTDARSEEVDPEQDFRSVPDDLAYRLRDLFQARGRQAFHNPDANVQPNVMPWGEGAKAIYSAFSSECLRRGDSDTALQPHLARTAEMALRLATIRAIGRDIDHPIVEAEDIEWGRDLALWSAERMAEEAGDFVGDTDQSQLWAKIVRKLESSPDGRVSKATLQNAVGRSFKLTNEAIDDLVRMGRVAVLDVKPARGPMKKMVALLARSTTH